MKVEEMAAIHAAAMVHSRVWGVPTLEGFLSGPGAILAKVQNAFALGRVVANEAELLTIAVHPDAQGKGLGRTCLGAIEREALAKGARRMFLEVSDANAPAISLYLSAGYETIGRRTAYYTAPDGKKTDALMMSKTFAPA